jgi:predicted P-loop ATPase
MRIQATLAMQKAKNRKKKFSPQEDQFYQVLLLSIHHQVWIRKGRHTLNTPRNIATSINLKNKEK